MFASLFLILVLANAQSKSEIEPIVVVETPKTPRELVTEISKKYNVSEALVAELITLESNWNTKLQSFCIYKKDNPKLGIKAGEREKSYGLAQIHLPAHPHITYEQATDPEFAIEFIASEIAEGRGGQWSCYRTAKYNVANGKSGGKCTV